MTWDVPGFSDAGQLDHPITFLAFTLAQDEYGEVVYTWAPYADDWAELVTLSAAERMQAAQLQGVVDVALRIRWRNDLTTEMRVQIDDGVYDLVGPPREVGRHRFLDLLVKLRAAGQPARAGEPAGQTTAPASAPVLGWTLP